MGFKGTKLYCFVLNVVDRLNEIDAGFKDMKPGGWRWYEEGNSGQTQILWPNLTILLLLLLTEQLQGLP